ncbi:uncharacterized protein LOC111883632 [Lactuca sativa]|nr:uncharacterized protein LOC111883632 [Lactuca sativa]
MGDHNVTLIDDVDALRDDLTLKVRVINLWKHMSCYNKDDIWAIELILLDEKGSKIQATVYKKCLYRFINMLKDGSAFYITNPSVASQKPSIFKLTPQDQKLTFVQDTVVTKCAEFSGTKFEFSFIEYESILSFLHPQDTSVDVIGLVVAVSEMMRDNSDKSKDKSKHRLTIHIQDASALQLRVILWGDYAYKMQNYIDNNPPNQHTVQVLTPTLHLQSCSSILTLMKLLSSKKDVDDRPDSSSNTISVIESKQLSEFDDFLVRTKLKTIAEIFEPLEVFILILLTVGSDSSAVHRITGFSNWLLDIGEGNLGGPNDGEAIVDIPEDILINDLCDPIGSLINFVYPSILETSTLRFIFKKEQYLLPRMKLSKK